MPRIKMVNKVIEWSSFNPTGNEARYLQDAFESGWVSAGSYVEKLEAALDDIFSGSHCFAVSNGTSALQLAFQVLDVCPGDQVVVPAFCFQAGGNVLSQLGAVPVFCDVDPLTWNQNLASVRRAVTPETVGIVLVHNYGRAVPSREIADWARSKGLWVVEDCAEAWFTTYDGKYVGQFGDIGTFSMHATKTISSGEGGVVMLNDCARVKKLKLLRSHGLNRSKLHYMHELAGNNYRLSNLLCAVAFGQLEQRNRIVSMQKARNDAYREFLEGHWAITLQQPVAGAGDNVWAIGARISTSLLEASRDEIIDMMKTRGIDTRPGFYPASALTYDRHYIKEKLHVSDSIAKDILVLPCSSRLERETIRYVCDVLKDILSARRKSGTQYNFIDLKSDLAAHALLPRLVARLGDGAKSFRYFDKRDSVVVHGHDVSVLLEVEGDVAGYGHIETVEGTSWLGIAAVQDEVGKGWGKIIMTRLLRDAMRAGINEINLRVDRGNEAAINLYRCFGFAPLPERSNSEALHMSRIATNIR